MNRELHRLFDNLAGRSTTFVRRPGGTADVSGLTPVNPSRFQVMNTTIQYLASNHGRVFSGVPNMILDAFEFEELKNTREVEFTRLNNFRWTGLVFLRISEFYSKYSTPKVEFKCTPMSST